MILNHGPLQSETLRDFGVDFREISYGSKPVKDLGQKVFVVMVCSFHQVLQDHDHLPLDEFYFVWFLQVAAVYNE